MLARVHSCWVHGVDGRPVTVEVSVHPGLPVFTVVGLPATAVRESKDRVYAALAQVDHSITGLRITVNLAPADLPKSGSAFDLPMAVGLLVARGAVPAGSLDGTAFAGELGLDGSIRSVRGAVALTMGAAAEGHARLVLPAGNVAEASGVPGVEVLGARTLQELIEHLRGTKPLPPASAAPAGAPGRVPDLAEVRGQAFAKQALAIAAAGSHNMLMSGPPGAGKTMLARRLPGLLPPLTSGEALEVNRVHSVAGLLGEGAPPVQTRPFRAPHHTISTGGLVGGGNPPRPGEVSLAHLGVLFLDELPEFRRGVLETLRQPLEVGRVRVSRVRYALTFPARFQLVAAMNPCPCGLGGDDCICGDTDVHRYRSRLSGPLLDRIDIQIHLRPIPWEDLMGAGAGSGESSNAVQERVVEARRRQSARGPGTPNSQLHPALLMDACLPTREALGLLERSVDHFRLSARGIHRILRVARTVADLDGSECVTDDHVALAVQLRTGLGPGRRAPGAGATRVDA